MSGAPTAEEIMAGMHKAVAETEVAKGAKPSAPPKPDIDAPDEKRKLRSLVDRIVRLEEEKKGLGSDIKDIYEEAKSAGYSKRAIRLVVKREMEDSDQRAAREAAETEAELIIASLGDFASSPLGEAAVGRGKH